MSRAPLVAPSILAADFGRLTEEIKAVDAAGADLIHIDVMDGHFVPNITIGPMFVEVAKKATGRPLDVHLMIEEPERYLADFVNAGADILTVHAETCPHLHGTIQTIRALGAKPCVALNPSTGLEAVEHVLDELDMVLVMTVNPGFGGQKFIHSMTKKVRTLRSQIEDRGLDVDIEVDGGIKGDNADVIASAGANVLVSGSGIFGKDDYKAAIAQIRARAEEAMSDRAPTNR